MNIKEIRKEMTREEFIAKLEGDEHCKFIYNKEGYNCPHHIGIINECLSMNCKKCWLEAIKNVKFKDEEIEVNQELWNEFLNGKVAVNCQTEAESLKFLNLCKEYEIYFRNDKVDYKEFGKYTCYDFAGNWLTFASKDYYEESNIKVITYQQLITPTTKEECTLGEEKKTYKGWEILKMIDDEVLKDKDIILDKVGVGRTVERIKNACVSFIFNFSPFTIKEREYMTFDEVKKLGGIPKHKNISDWRKKFILNDFLNEIDKKVWYVEVEE